MKTKLALLLSLLLGISNTPATAAECTSSFYCYGNTANSVSKVATRPPPIPPPNPRVVQQRRQAQIALRNRPAPQQVARPTPRVNVQPTQPVTRPAPRANVQPAPQAVTRPAPQAVARPNNANQCQQRLSLAAQLESQAVIAAKQNNRQASVRLFREAANLRQACR